MFVENGAAVSELACKIYFHGNTAVAFDKILSYHARVVRASARYNEYFIQIFEIAVGETKAVLCLEIRIGVAFCVFFSFEPHRVSEKPRAHCLLERLGLLEYFFEHIMGIAVLCRRFDVPIDGVRLA